ncbi:MAG: hypothetical protein ACW967_03165, partial [Candidatus Hodarchaeales archaeon]
NPSLYKITSLFLISKIEGKKLIFNLNSRNSGLATSIYLLFIVGNNLVFSSIIFFKIKHLEQKVDVNISKMLLLLKILLFELTFSPNRGVKNESVIINFKFSSYYSEY